MQHTTIFLIGPGGVGKSTTGPLVAERLGYRLIDIDHVYLEKYGNITQHVKEIGYEYYTQNNRVLFEELVNSGLDSSVIVLSGGFLGYYEYEKLSLFGTCVVLMPHEDNDIGLDIIVERQSKRDFFIDMTDQRQKSKRRMDLYQDVGDIRVITYNLSPHEVAEKVVSGLNNIII